MYDGVLAKNVGFRPLAIFTEPEPLKSGISDKHTAPTPHLVDLIHIEI